MEEIISALSTSYKIHPELIAVWSTVFAPFVIWCCAVLVHRWRERDIAPPQSEKLLRPAGYSLMCKFDKFDNGFFELLKAGLMCMIAGAGAWIGGLSLGRSGPLWFTIYFFALLSVALYPALVLTLRAFHRIIEYQQLRLGMRGEQAVGEALQEVTDAGYRAFHDLQPEGTWNIDHVVVGPGGVFVIETKARRRHPIKGDAQPRHVIIYDGQSMIYPNGIDRNAVPQVQRNAAWVADFLAKRTCEVTPVEAMVVVPGWYTESKGNFPVKVMNTSYLRNFLRRQPGKIDPVQVKRIIAALDEKCRTLEF